MDLNIVTAELALMNINGNYELSPVRNKDGVYVARVLQGGASYIIKYFENPDFRREISNYELLQSVNVSTISVINHTDKSILLDDISASYVFRLGVAEDLENKEVAAAVADWYRLLHDNSKNASDLSCLYCETDELTEQNLITTAEKSNTRKNEIWQLILNNMDKLQKVISRLDMVINYNDFYWTNLAVAKNLKSAFMFDYNLLGKGYRYSDIRNVMSSLASGAKEAFLENYGEYDETEKIIDQAVSELINLISAYKKSSFPAWGKDSLELLMNGSLYLSIRKALELV